MEPPFLVTNDDLVSTMLTPRFCIREQHGLRAAKFRLIGDLSRLWVNHATSMSDAYPPQSIDHLLAMCRLLGMIGARDLKLRIADFANAYKTTPIHGCSRAVAHVVFASLADNGIYMRRVSLFNLSASARRRKIGGALLLAFNFPRGSFSL